MADCAGLRTRFRRDSSIQIRPPAPFICLRACPFVAEGESDEPANDEDEQETAERKRVTKRDRKAKRSYSRYRHGGRRGTRGD